ncbi:MAG: aspartate--ammonia ligase [Tissierellales bacterium]|jgi:aspartate--ammonia ligase|nr:aspartate--ammonia ligase [Tissierellales bacterium]MBN2827447.1 aspartate--ammonia ligase [Tissierellales bacterium]
MIDKIYYPENYRSSLNVLETEIAIKKIKDFFQKNLSQQLNLTRVSAPLFVAPETGLNDNLNGYERPVNFTIKDLYEKKVEIVQSLAKWKRMALYKYAFKSNEGLYTDMNAIRRDESLDNLHSIYVDQWDWEKIISKEDRTIDYLKDTVRKIYASLKELDNYIVEEYAFFSPLLPDDITFITAQELEDTYPDLSPKLREDAVAKKYGAVFIIGIGNELKSGSKHDGRAPDYDDWHLNGDIILWNPILQLGLEISSMGVRVDSEALERQLEITGDQDRKRMSYHQMILNNELPLTIGGGIGQSRLCLFFLRKAHIGEVQSSIWPADMKTECENRGIFLL